jgi:hypothetical protein
MSKKTATECKNSTCDGCEIDGKIMCIHTKKQAFKFGLGSVPFMILLISGMIIGKFYLWLAIWFGLVIIFFVYVEVLILCRHCPHYAEPGKTLKCHANWGLPKISKYDPKPLTTTEKVVWIIYVLIMVLWYVPFFIISVQWIMFATTTIVWITGFTLLLTTRCTKCYVISCPLNRTPPEVRKIFFRNYPKFAESYEDR